MIKKTKNNAPKSKSAFLVGLNPTPLSIALGLGFDLHVLHIFTHLYLLQFICFIYICKFLEWSIFCNQLT